MKQMQYIPESQRSTDNTDNQNTAFSALSIENFQVNIEKLSNTLKEGNGIQQEAFVPALKEYLNENIKKDLTTNQSVNDWYNNL